eukprot:gene13803-19718_t
MDGDRGHGFVESDTDKLTSASSRLANVSHACLEGANYPVPNEASSSTVGNTIMPSGSSNYESMCNSYGGKIPLAVCSSPERPIIWIEVTIKTVTDHEEGMCSLMIVQEDVSERENAINQLCNLNEAQLSIMAQTYPRHIIDYLSVSSLNEAPDVQAADVLTFLNELFTPFDHMCDLHDVQKVETAGDCYIVAAGIIEKEPETGFCNILETHDPVHSATKVLAFAKSMLSHSKTPVVIRLGMHTGPCVSGLIGTKLPKFSIFGDSMNTASRIKSTCKPGPIQIKGKGLMNTSILNPEDLDLEGDPVFDQEHCRGANSLSSLIVATKVVSSNGSSVMAHHSHQEQVPVSHAGNPGLTRTGSTPFLTRTPSLSEEVAQLSFDRLHLHSLSNFTSPITSAGLSSLQQSTRSPSSAPVGPKSAALIWSEDRHSNPLENPTFPEKTSQRVMSHIFQVSSGRTFRDRDSGRHSRINTRHPVIQGPSQQFMGSVEKVGTLTPSSSHFGLQTEQPTSDTSRQPTADTSRQPTAILPSSLTKVRAWVKRVDSGVKTSESGAIKVGPAEEVVGETHALPTQGTADQTEGDITDLCETVGLAGLKTVGPARKFAAPRKQDSLQSLVVLARAARSSVSESNLEGRSDCQRYDVAASLPDLLRIGGRTGQLEFGKRGVNKMGERRQPCEPSSPSVTLFQPSDMDISTAIEVCPFLSNVCSRQGEQYARSIAINPIAPAPSARRPLLEETDDFQTTFRLFHGPSSPVPLPSDVFEKSRVHLARPAASRDARSGLEAGELAHATIGRSQTSETYSSGPSRMQAALAQAPFAAMSIGGMPDFGDFFRKFQQGRSKGGRHDALRRKAPGQDPKPKPDITRRAASSASPSLSSTNPSSAGCPLRKFLGPYAGVVFNPAGHFTCPQVIIKARAVLASTQAVRTLRPQALPIKLAAVGIAAATINIPCGMWREHTKKFSLEWIFAVHATIPFIAMLRKAVIMPKAAILFTVLSAVAGQAIGARLERERLDLLKTASLAQPASLPELEPEHILPARTAACTAPTPAPRSAHHKAQKGQKSKKHTPMLTRRTLAMKLRIAPANQTALAGCGNES